MTIRVCVKIHWVAAIILRRLDGSVSKSVIFVIKEHAFVRNLTEFRQRVKPI